MAGPRQIVEGPTFSKLPYGLWDSIQHPAPEGAHWQNGITWVDRCPTGDTVMDECIAVTGTGGAPTAQQSLSGNVTQTNRGATSFTIYAEFECSPVGLNDAATIAARSLDQVEDWQVERAFWTGVAGKSGGVATTTVFPHLAANTALSDSAAIVLQPAASVVATGSGDDLAITLGELEAALDDCYHGEGLIHMTREAAASFFAWKLLDEDDNVPGVLRTRSGHRVVLGSGYTGSGPDGAAAPASTSWIYGTGAVFGYRSAIDMPTTPQSFDRVENTYRLIAQRTYVLGFECCLFAARVNLGVPT